MVLDRGKPKNYEKYMVKCHFVLLKSLTDSHGIRGRLLPKEAGVSIGYAAN
jgi:hypothetical protein